jgi:hypothetical protein
MMRIDRFRDIVDVYGADPSLWPQADRTHAEGLLAAEPAARTYLHQARRLDASLAALSAISSARQEAESAARICDAMAAGPLPPQRRGLLSWRWPTLLLDVDLAPAWPRVAALACAAGIGIAIGLFGTDASLLQGRSGAAVAAADIDFTGLAFDAEPLTGVTP